MGACKAIFGNTHRDNQNQVVAGVAFVQVALMLVINIWGLWRYHRARKRMETSRYEEPRENTFLLPIYSRLMWTTCFALLIDALIHYVTPFSIIHSNSLTASFLNGVAYFVRQFCFEVVAFFLMSPSAGQRAITKAYLLASIWSLITFGLKFAYTYNVEINPRYSTSFDLLWLSMLLAFYYLVIFFPRMHILFRRPAIRSYAAFWAFIYTSFLISTVLRHNLVDAGYCLYIANSGLVLGLCPWIVYKVCRDDSLYWQGTADLGNHEKSITTVAQDNPVGSDVAANVALADNANVKVINFVSLKIDTASDGLGKDGAENKAVVGHGTYARVFKGLYRGNKVAIKLIYAPELTREMVGNFMKEAATLQSLNNKNIVKVEGVCIMPPAIALVMELCKCSLFDYLHPPKETEYALEHEREQREKVEVVVDGITPPKKNERAAIAALRSRLPITSSTLGQSPVTLEEHASEDDDDDDDDDYVPLPPLLDPLPILEQVRIMLECARAIAFIHEAKNPMVHLDIKSGNFLMASDEKNTIRLADFELATRAKQKSRDAQMSLRTIEHLKTSPSRSTLRNTQNVEQVHPHPNGEQGESAEHDDNPELNYSCKDCATCQEGGALATCFAKCLDCITKAMSRNNDLLGKDDVIVPEAPNWLAPELMLNDKPIDSISPACDVYSLGCVFWEIATRRVPFEELAVHFRELNEKISRAKKEFYNRRAREAAAARAAQAAAAHAAPSQPRKSIVTYPSRAAAEAAIEAIEMDAMNQSSHQSGQSALGERPSTPQIVGLPSGQVARTGIGAYPSRAVPPWAKRRSTVYRDTPQMSKTQEISSQSTSTSSVSQSDPKNDNQDASTSSAVVVNVPGVASSAVSANEDSSPASPDSAAETIELTAPPEQEGIVCYDDADIPLHESEPFDIGETLYDWIKNHEYRPPVPRDIPLEVQWCIRAAWAPLPHQRPRAKKLVQILTSLYARLQQERGYSLTTTDSIVSSSMRMSREFEMKDGIETSDTSPISPMSPITSNENYLPNQLSVSTESDNENQVIQPVTCSPSNLVSPQDSIQNASITPSPPPEPVPLVPTPPAAPPCAASTTPTTSTVTTTPPSSSQAVTTSTVIRPTPPASPRPPANPKPPSD